MNILDISYTDIDCGIPALPLFIAPGNEDITAICIQAEDIDLDKIEATKSAKEFYNANKKTEDPKPSEKVVHADQNGRGGNCKCCTSFRQAEENERIRANKRKEVNKKRSRIKKRELVSEEERELLKDFRQQHGRQKKWDNSFDIGPIDGGTT